MSNLSLFNRLKSKQQKAVVLCAEGTKYEAIAAEVGCAVMTIRRWLGPGGTLLTVLTEYTTHLAQERLRQSEELEKKIAADRAILWERLLEMTVASDIPPSVKQTALDSALDRAGLLRSSRTESVSETTIHSLTPEETEAKFKKIRELRADLKVVG